MHLYPTHSGIPNMLISNWNLDIEATAILGAAFCDHVRASIVMSI